MIQKMCSVYDSAAQVFGRPFFVPTTAVAIRSFRDEVNRPDANNDLHRHPADFALYHIADFDDNSGRLLVNDSPVCLQRAIDVSEKPQQ